MADLRTCLNLQSFDPEDVAEIRGYIDASGGDPAAGVQAYLDSVEGDLANLSEQVADALGMTPGMEIVPEDATQEVRDLARKLGAGARIAELINDPAMAQAEADMNAIQPTVSEEIAADFDALIDFARERTYVDPETGAAIGNVDAMLARVWTDSAQWASQGVRNQRRAIILTGAPAAGKSTLAERMANDTGARILDSDEIKKMIPEYRGGIGAAAVHEESSGLSKLLLKSALETGDNLILPKVGDNPAKMERAIAELKREGYEVDLVAMEVDPEEAFRRMVSRFIQTGRLIPPQYAANAATKPAQTYAMLRSKGVADGYAQIDNNQPFGEDPTVLEDVTRSEVGRGLRQPAQAGRAGEGGGDAQAQGPQAELRVLRQGANRRAPETTGRETSVAMPTNLAAASELALGNRFQTGREFKLALQDIARGTHGETLLAINDENQAKIADFIFEDALEAAQDNQNAIGWYDNAVTRAKTEMAKIYPEIAEGAEAEFAFIWGLAVTSNGLKVDKNFELAAQVYETWKETGSFPTNAGIGTAAVQINNGLKMYERLLSVFNGDWKAARDFMVSEQPVRDIEATTGISISGEGKGETIRGAGVLGPKIGNGFFSNLYGHFDGLTMDRWLMRSVGRWRGSLIFINEPMIEKKRGELFAILDQSTPEELTFLQGFFNGSDLDLTNPDLDLMAQQIAKRSMDKGWRQRFSEAANGKGDLLRKAGNLQARYLDGQVEAPAGAGERSFIRGAFRSALERLQQEPGMERLTMADLQALLWYPEKLLYESAKKPAGEEIKSYADDEAPDYGNAARNLVRGRLGRDAGGPADERGAVGAGPGTDEGVRVLNQSRDDAPRGQITIPAAGVGNATTVISLFESADLSTFFHETAHFMLEVMHDLEAKGTEAVADDLAVIRKFVGAAEGQQGFTTEQHEKFARGFEAYLMEGKAPSLELADVFQTVKAWLTRIYNSLAGLDVKLSDEMREVFDRMLATDEAIEAARAQQALRPLFAQKPPLMSETDWKTYQRMARRSTEEAEQRLLGKVMAKITRETKAWWKDERSALRETVAEEVNARPEYRLIEALSNRRWLGDEAREVPDFRIDRQALVDEFGNDIVAQLDRSRFGVTRNIFGNEEGNASPAEVAEFFGFESAREMVDTLRNTVKRDVRIDTETDARMTQRHGDPFTDGTIEQEAMDAIHGEQQSATAVQEAREIRRQLGGNPTGMTSQVYRARARQMIGRMTVAQASKPARFLAAERRAAKDAEAAFSRVARGGDEAALTEAFMAKERQILNQHLYTAARQVETDVAKARQRMMNYRKASVRQKLDGIYIEQIDALLEEYDFRQRTPGQVKKVSQLSRYIDEMVEAGREAELNIDPRLVEGARRVHYSQLSVDELNGLVETIANIDHMGRFKQKLIDRQRKRDLANSATRVADTIRTSLKAKPITQPESGLLGWINLLSKPDTIFIRLDGGEEFGPVWEEVKRPLDESVAVEAEMQSRVARDLDAVYRKHYTPKEMRAAQKSRSIDGVTHPWSKAEILALAMNMGNRDNYQRVMAENVHETRQLDEAQLAALLDTLEDRDWRFVQDHIDFINSLWPDLAEVHKRRTGTNAKKVEAEVMYPGAPSFFKGGYYPIGYDPRRSQAAQRDKETATDRYMTAGHGSTAQVGNGMTKQRERTGGGRTVDYDLSVGFRHLRDTTRYIALSEAVDNAHRVLNHSEVRSAMADTGSLNTHETLNLWIKDTAMGPVFNNDRVNSLFRATKNNFTLSRLAFNLKTVILQATGLTQSAVVIGKRNMLRGMMRYYSSPSTTLAEIEALSPKMRERKSTFQKDMYDFLTSTQDQRMFGEAAINKGRRVVGQAGFEPIVMMQYYVVDVPTWMGAYAKYLTEYNGNQERAALAADKMVERAQDTGLVSERSAVERGTLSRHTVQSDVVRLFTTLSGYMMTKMNRAGVRYLQGKNAIANSDTAAGKAAAAANLALDILILYAFEAVMMGVMYELLDDDDDLNDLNEFLLRETGSAVVSGIPMVRDAGSAFSGYGEGGVYGSMTGMFPRLYQQNIDQGFEFDRAMRRSWLDVIGAFTGLPTTATGRLVEGFLDADNTSPSEALLGSNPLNR